MQFPVGLCKKCSKNPTGSLKHSPDFLPGLIKRPTSREGEGKKDKAFLKQNVPVQLWWMNISQTYARRVWRCRRRRWRRRRAARGRRRAPVWSPSATEWCPESRCRPSCQATRRAAAPVHGTEKCPSTETCAVSDSLDPCLLPAPTSYAQDRYNHRSRIRRATVASSPRGEINVGLLENCRKIILLSKTFCPFGAKNPSMIFGKIYRQN